MRLFEFSGSPAEMLTLQEIDVIFVGMMKKLFSTKKGAKKPL
jgi:hypothetical protein